MAALVSNASTVSVLSSPPPRYGHSGITCALLWLYLHDIAPASSIIRTMSGVSQYTEVWYQCRAESGQYEALYCRQMSELRGVNLIQYMLTELLRVICLNVAFNRGQLCMFWCIFVCLYVSLLIRPSSSKCVWTKCRVTELDVSNLLWNLHSQNGRRTQSFIQKIRSYKVIQDVCISAW